MRERHDATRARETPIQPLVLALLALACRTEQTLLAELTNAERAAIGTPEHWSPRDLVAHSASWRRLQTGKLDAATRGKPLPVWRDEVVINQLNAETCATNQHRPWDDIYAESVRIYEGLMAQIARMTEDMLTGNTGKNGNGASSPPRVGEGVGGEVNPGKNGNGAPSLTPGNQTPSPPRRGGGRGEVISGKNGNTAISSPTLLRRPADV